MKISALLAGIGLMGLPMTAQACPTFNLDVEPVMADTYNPNDLQPVSLQVELVLLDFPVGTTCTSNTIEITSRGTAGVYTLADGAQIVTALPSQRSNTFRQINLTRVRLSPAAVNTLVRTGRVTAEFARIAPGNFVQAGRYSNILDVKLNGQAVDSFEPELIVEPAMRLLGDVSGELGHIDFGSLESFEQASKRFVFQSNSRLNISARSENGGALVHEDGRGFGAVPYTVSLGSNTLSLGTGQTMALNNAIGQQVIATLDIRVGEVMRTMAGEYSDVVTLSFVAE